MAREQSCHEQSFQEKCYKILSRVPRGRVTTYSEIARKLGSKAFRAVGNAMHGNPYAPRIPCHRVVRANGDIGGFAGGTRQKIRMLKREGIAIKNGKIENLKDYFYRL